MLIVTPSPQLMPSIFEAARQACQAEPLFRHAVFPDAFLKSTDSYISTILFQVAEEKVQLLLVHPAIPGTEALFRHCKRQYPEIYCIAVAPMEPASQIEDAADLVLYPPLPGEAFQTLSSAKANTGKGPSAVLTSVKANVTQDPSAAPASTNANVTQDPSAAPASTGANVTKDPSTAPAFAVAEADLTPAQRKQNKALRAQYWESHAQCLEDLLLYIKNHDPASTVNDGLSLPEALQDYAQRKNLRR